MNLGSTIKYFRTQRGFSQKALAKAARMTAPYLSLLENNQRAPAMAMLENIAKELGVPVPILMFYAMEESDVPPPKRELFRSVFEPVKSLIATSFIEK